jgi:hypothetical protein
VVEQPASSSTPENKLIDFHVAFSYLRVNASKLISAKVTTTTTYINHNEPLTSPTSPFYWLIISPGKIDRPQYSFTVRLGFLTTGIIRIK